MAFWKEKQLSEMTSSEWESLCDGCGLCCLHKLEDVETLTVEFTCVKCAHLNEQRQCDVYSERIQKVEGCLNVRNLGQEHYHWLPSSCAYRRLSENQPLPLWHPLITGNSKTMEEGGYAVGEWAISENIVNPDLDFIIRVKASDS